MCLNKSCLKCGLYNYQKPIYDDEKLSDIMWVGLSAKLINNDFKAPLDLNTASGKIISDIEMMTSDFVHYKTNLVKCAPLNDAGKLRYPFKSEMDFCFDNLLLEVNNIKPKIIFLLGKIVSDFILSKNGFDKIALSDNFKYKSVQINDVLYYPIHHPSYISVYKKKFCKQYIDSIVDIIKSNI